MTRVAIVSAQAETEHRLRAEGWPCAGVSPMRVARSREHLPSLFYRLGFRSGAEIGVWKGQYSEALCAANPDLRLLCVDPWSSAHMRTSKDLDAAYREAKTRLAPYHCTLCRQLSVTAARDVPDASLDFVYVDADHSAQAVRSDLKAWLPKIRSGGIVAGHDYFSPPRRTLAVKPTVDRYVRWHQISPWWVLTADYKPSFMWVVA